MMRRGIIEIEECDYQMLLGEYKWRGKQEALNWVMEEMRKNNEDKQLEAWKQLAELTLAIGKELKMDMK